MQNSGTQTPSLAHYTGAHSLVAQMAQRRFITRHGTATRDTRPHRTEFHCRNHRCACRPQNPKRERMHAKKYLRLGSEPPPIYTAW